MKILISVTLFLLSSASWAAMPVLGISPAENVVHKASVNGKDVLEVPIFKDVHKFLVVLKIDKPGDLGYCTGALIEDRIILTAAHCIHNATKVTVYFYSRTVDGTLKYSAQVAQRYEAPHNWNAGYPVGKSKHYDQQKKMVDLAVVLVKTAPVTSAPIAMAQPDTIASPKESLYAFGLDNLFPLPHFEGPRIATLSIRNATQVETSSLFWGGRVSDLYPPKRTGLCIGDSGAPVVSVANGKIALIGVIGGGSVGKDTAIDPSKGEKLSDKGCGEFVSYRNATMHSREIEQLKQALLSLPNLK